MELDPIEYLLQHSQKRISLSILINAHSRLSIIQMNKGNVSFEDIMQSLTLSINAEMSSNELNGYAGLIYEGCFLPFMSPKGPVLRINRDIIGNDANFLKSILNILYLHSDGNEYTLIEDFKQDASAFLKKNNTSFANQDLASNSTGGDQASALATVVPAASGIAQQPKKQPVVPSKPILSEETDEKTLLSIGAEIERNEPIIRLLAHIRKAGMDILFPQMIHDKILMAIYVAIKCASSLAHRELIDMVMAVKEARAISQLENVSRTKVRGVLALLKHAQLFVTHGEDGEAVRLHLAQGINAFKDLREKHDLFVNRCILQHHLFIPIALKGELVWQFDADAKVTRLEELKPLEQSLENFFAGGAYAQIRAAAAAAPPAPPASMSPPIPGPAANVQSAASVSAPIPPANTHQQLPLQFPPTQLPSQSNASMFPNTSRMSASSFAQEPESSRGYYSNQPQPTPSTQNFPLTNNRLSTYSTPADRFGKKQQSYADYLNAQSHQSTTRDRGDAWFNNIGPSSYSGNTQHGGNKIYQSGYSHQSSGYQGKRGYQPNQSQGFVPNSYGQQSQASYSKFSSYNQPNTASNFSNGSSMNSYFSESVAPIDFSRRDFKETNNFGSSLYGNEADFMRSTTSSTNRFTENRNDRSFLESNNIPPYWNEFSTSGSAHSMSSGMFSAASENDTFNGAAFGESSSAKFPSNSSFFSNERDNVPSGLQSANFMTSNTQNMTSDATVDDLIGGFHSLPLDDVAINFEQQENNNYDSLQG